MFHWTSVKGVTRREAETDVFYFTCWIIYRNLWRLDERWKINDKDLNITSRSKSLYLPCVRYDDVSCFVQVQDYVHIQTQTQIMRHIQLNKTRQSPENQSFMSQYIHPKILLAQLFGATSSPVTTSNVQTVSSLPVVPLPSSPPVAELPKTFVHELAH